MGWFSGMDNVDRFFLSLGIALILWGIGNLIYYFSEGPRLTQYKATNNTIDDIIAQQNKEALNDTDIQENVEEITNELSEKICFDTKVEGKCHKSMTEVDGCCYFQPPVPGVLEQAGKLTIEIGKLVGGVIFGSMTQTVIASFILRSTVNIQMSVIRKIKIKQVLNSVELAKLVSPADDVAIAALKKVMKLDADMYAKSIDTVIKLKKEIIKEGTTVLEKVGKKVVDKFGNKLTTETIKETTEKAIQLTGKEAAELMMKNADEAAKLIGKNADEIAKFIGLGVDDAAKLLSYSDETLDAAELVFKNGDELLDVAKLTAKYGDEAAAAVKLAVKGGYDAVKAARVAKLAVKAGAVAGKGAGVAAKYTFLGGLVIMSGPVGLAITAVAFALDVLTMAYDMGFGWFHGYNDFQSNEDIRAKRDNIVSTSQIHIVEGGGTWPLFFQIVLSHQVVFTEAAALADIEPMVRTQEFLANDVEYFELLMSDSYAISSMLWVVDMSYTDENLERSIGIINSATERFSMTREEQGLFLFDKMKELLGDDSELIEQYPDFFDNECFGISLSKKGVDWWNNKNADYFLGISTEVEAAQYVAYTKQYLEIDKRNSSEDATVLKTSYLDNKAPLVRVGAYDILNLCYSIKQGNINPYDYGVRYNPNTEMCEYTREYCDRYGIEYYDYNGTSGNCRLGAGDWVSMFTVGEVAKDWERGVASAEAWSAPKPTSCPSGYARTGDKCYIKCPSTHVKRPSYPGQCAKECASGTTQITEDGTQSADGLYCRIKALDYMTPDVSRGADKICPVGYNSNPSYPNRCRENKYTAETYLEGKIVSEPSTGYTIGNNGSDIYQYTGVSSNGNCPSNTTKSGNKCKASIETRPMGSSEKVCPTDYQAPDALGSSDITPAFECYHKSPIDSFDVYVTGNGAGDYMYTEGATNNNNLTMKLGNSVWEVKDQKSSKINNSSNPKDPKACASNVPYQYSGECYDTIPGWIPNLALPKCNVGESVKPDIYGNIHKDYSTCEKITL